MRVISTIRIYGFAWCDSAFHNGYGGFLPDADDSQPPVMFSNQLFWDDDIAEPSRMWPDGENAPVLTSPVLAGTLMPLLPPDMDRTVRLDNSELELLHNRIDEFSVLSLGTGDTFMDMDALDGDALGACTRDVGILDGDEGWLCLLFSATSVAVGLDCKGLGHCHRASTRFSGEVSVTDSRSGPSCTSSGVSQTV